MLPIPNNLKDILVPSGNENDEFTVFGDLLCTCRSAKFEINYVAETVHGAIKAAEIKGKSFLIIRCVCTNCSLEYDLFDKDFNGWNGFVCEGFGNRAIARPSAEKWNCRKCNSVTQRISVKIHSKGKQDFVEETEGKFEENYWTEAYSWIKIDLQCPNCGFTDEEWISYETM